MRRNGFEVVDRESERAGVLEFDLAPPAESSLLFFRKVGAGQKALGIYAIGEASEVIAMYVSNQNSVRGRERMLQALPLGLVERCVGAEQCPVRVRPEGRINHDVPGGVPKLHADKDSPLGREASPCRVERGWKFCPADDTDANLLRSGSDRHTSEDLERARLAEPEARSLRQWHRAAHPEQAGSKSCQNKSHRGQRHPSSRLRDQGSSLPSFARVAANAAAQRI